MPNIISLTYANKYLLCRNIPTVVPLFGRFLKERGMFISFMKGSKKTLMFLGKHDSDRVVCEDTHYLITWAIDKSLIWDATDEKSGTWLDVYNEWYKIVHDKLSISTLKELEIKLMELAVKKYNAKIVK